MFYSIPLCYVPLCSIIWYYILFCSVPFRSVPFCSIQLHSILSYPAPFHSIIYVGILLQIHQLWFQTALDVQKHTMNFTPLARYLLTIQGFVWNHSWWNYSQIPMWITFLRGALSQPARRPRSQTPAVCQRFWRPPLHALLRRAQRDEGAVETFLLWGFGSNFTNYNLQQPLN